MRRALLLFVVKPLNALERPAHLFLNCLLALAGRRRVSWDWPNNDVVEAALSTFEELGAERLRSTPINLPIDAENLNFRVRGRRVRLWVEQYGDVILWGPRATVTELTARINEKLARRTHQRALTSPGPASAKL
jgi:hypothetical protein